MVSGNNEDPLNQVQCSKMDARESSVLWNCNGKKGRNIFPFHQNLHCHVKKMSIKPSLKIVEKRKDISSSLMHLDILVKHLPPI